MKKIFLLLITILTLSSCIHKKIENTIEGLWSMDTIYYKRYNIKTCLGDNSIYFKIGDKSEFPVAKNDCGSIIKNSFEQSADISLVKSAKINDTIPYRLKIETNNEIFAGLHKIVFYKDEANHLLKMEIFSDNLYVVCRKGLFNYDENITLINELEKVTWTNRPKH